MSEEKFDGLTGKSGGGFLVRLPTGRLVTLGQLLSQEGQGHVEIDAARMKAGDVVIANYENLSGASNDNKDKPPTLNIQLS